MNICFIGHRYSEKITNGVHVSTLTLARAIASLNHNVFLYGVADTNDSFVDSYGITHRYTTSKRMGSKEMAKIIQEDKDQIDIYCFQSVFIPANFWLSRIVAKTKKPYVVFPRGGYNANIFKRNRLKKFLYFSLIERIYLYKASGVVCISEKEIPEVRKIGYKGPVKVTYNPINSYSVTNQDSYSLKAEKKIIYLGRFDIEHKGLDILLQLAGEIHKIDPAISIDLYGNGPDKEKLLTKIRKEKLSYIQVHDPVYGETKLDTIRSASAYIHTARWEGFGRSVAEAMMLGLPCIVSHTINLADEVFKSNQLDLVLGDDIQKNALDIINFLNDKPKLKEVGIRTQTVAQRLFNSTLVAQKTIDFLESLVPIQQTVSAE
ncbi:glycosyltransferase family 4 protein [Cytophagaceae bacterium DM2B3-1]|uniref:Glycosyltransferase family 4 protein n=1 Tax=Xanthocytophaga flava TaxID=3048013 RepID=A0ABT7CWE6_9BACT|nr:glycosyltransferase family 4 protein [Xanthocytophaga flavus]MDJ1498090.1 glycosyltransferase family 4 protein [Xanthocytophaga flavus]